MTKIGEENKMDMKPVKVQHTRIDDVRENHQCNCKKGGSCYREAHAEGMACEMMVTLSKNNRHKVCNQCRKSKVKKATGINNNSQISLSLPSMDMTASALMTSMSGHVEIPAPIPNISSGLGQSMIQPQQELINLNLPNPAMSLNASTIAVVNSGTMGAVGVGGVNQINPNDGRMPCQCDRGGSCNRAKHFADTGCDRFVTITKNDKHTRCKGCRYLKKKKVDGGVPIDGSNSQNSIAVPIIPHLVSMVNVAGSLNAPGTMQSMMGGAPQGIAMSMGQQVNMTNVMPNGVGMPPLSMPPVLPGGVDSASSVMPTGMTGYSEQQSL
jgi:hypothetical protein